MKNTKLTPQRILKIVNSFHKNHCLFHERNQTMGSPYEIDIQSVYDSLSKLPNDENNIKINDFLHKIDAELLVPNAPIKDNAKDLLYYYIMKIHELCGDNSDRNKMLEWLMEILVICSVCGHNDYFGGNWKCAGCKRSYCHECVSTFMYDDTHRKCKQCSRN